MISDPKGRTLIEMFECRVAGGRKKLNDEEIHNLHASPNITRVINDTARHVARRGEGRRKFHTTFWSEHVKANIPIVRLRRTWEDNIRMDLREIRWVD
jgi:hypothetical protein